ncbi:TOBE domain-containing protein [Pseudogemmobacter bohemicus]|uniref:TOBE domain-containing protein n=1 Tax=Pseudogemmobacter bohemicus TaxID=2250708 RepID=UPI001E4FB7D5|nr:TOBE domain-containing protein [Pseudogemmobacter bohemicus]
MRLRARNILPVVVPGIVTGTVTSHVRLAPGGSIIPASITNDAVKEPGPRVGAKASAVIKALM